MDVRPRGQWIWILAISACTLFLGLGSARLWDRDEPRNARCAQEMLERSDWIVPTFDGELRTHKPVLLYWLQMISYQTLGVNEWGARLPSALCGLITILSCYGIAARFFGSLAGFWSAICLATSVMFIVASRAATPDAPLIACTSLAIWTFVRAAYSPSPTVSFHWPTRLEWFTVYIACSMAVLAKGPVGLVLPGSVIGLLLIWQTWPYRSTESHSRFRRALTFLARFVVHAMKTAWWMRPLTAMVAVSFIAAPWYLAVGAATDGVWLREFFWTHNVSRAVTTMEGHSGPPVLFYLGTLCVGTFPWSIWLGPAAWIMVRQWREQPTMRPGIMLCLSWIGIYITCFSFAATKLPSYITPCYPAAAMAYGCLIARWVRNETSRNETSRNETSRNETSRNEAVLRRLGQVGLGIGTLIGIGLTGLFGMLLIGDQQPLEPLVPLGVVLATTSLAAIWMMQRHRSDLAIPLYAFGSVTLVIVLAGFGAKRIDDCRGDLALINETLKSAPPNRLAFIGDVEPSWVFYTHAAATRLPNADWEQPAWVFLCEHPSNTILMRRDQAERLTDHLQRLDTRFCLDRSGSSLPALNQEDYLLVKRGTEVYWQDRQSELRQAKLGAPQSNPH